MNGCEREGGGEKGIHLHSRKLFAFSLCIGERDIGILRSPFSTLFIDPRKHIPHFPFLRFIQGAHPTGHGHVNQCWGEGSRYTLLIPPPLVLSLLSPSSREHSLSNTMQHPPPIHRCFSHPLIALLDVISDKRILWRLE